jgi:ubiquinone/menaquinone biosynthesis C-methylase UbiE
MIASAEELPFDDGGFDTVVVTYSFALSLMQKKALEEMRRVLKPTGLLCFVNTELLQKRSSKGTRLDKSHLERSCRRMQFK